MQNRTDLGVAESDRRLPIVCKPVVCDIFLARVAPELDTSRGTYRP